MQTEGCWRRRTLSQLPEEPDCAEAERGHCQRGPGAARAGGASPSWVRNLAKLVRSLAGLGRASDIPCDVSAPPGMTSSIRHDWGQSALEGGDAVLARRAVRAFCGNPIRLRVGIRTVPLVEAAPGPGENRMTLATWTTVLLFALAEGAAPAEPPGSGSPPPAAAAVTAGDPEAMALLKRMCDRLRAAKTFTVRGQVSLELPVADGPWQRSSMTTTRPCGARTVWRPTGPVTWRTFALPTTGRP